MGCGECEHIVYLEGDIKLEVIQVKPILDTQRQGDLFYPKVVVSSIFWFSPKLGGNDLNN